MSESKNTAQRRLRDRLRTPLMIAGPVLVLAVVAFFYITGGRYESTDDAYVRVAQIAISSNVAGRVKEIAVHDNQPVRAGELLFRLGDEGPKIAVAEAEARLTIVTAPADGIVTKVVE